MTPSVYALRELARDIYIEAPVEIDGKRRQNIRIQYDFIGFIPLDEAIGRKVMLYPKKTSLLFYESLSCTRPLLSAAETKRYWGSTFRFKLV